MESIKWREFTIENEGIASRDFIYVEDIVNGLILCALKGDIGEVYNLATEQEVTIKTLANIVNELTENDVPMENKSARRWDTRKSIWLRSKIKRFNWIFCKNRYFRRLT